MLITQGNHTMYFGLEEKVRILSWNISFVFVSLFPCLNRWLGKTALAKTVLGVAYEDELMRC